MFEGGDPLVLIRVENDGTENPCDTTVNVRLQQGSGVGFQAEDGTVASTVRATYSTPPETMVDIPVKSVGGGGTASVAVSWSAGGGGCDGRGSGVFRFVVEGKKVRVTSSDVENEIFFGDPVSLATGELSAPQMLTPDFVLGGGLPMLFLRYYASYLSAEQDPGPLGRNWTHNFEVSLTVVGDAATVKLFGGKTIGFERDGEAWMPATAEKLAHQLVDGDEGGFRFLDLSSRRICSFDAAGLLTSIADRNGNTLTVQQGANGPETVTDGLGRMLTFTYTGGKLTGVADQNGRAWLFQHDGDDLTAATNPAGETTTYVYAAADDLAGLIASTTRPDVSIVTAQTYDDDARVATQTDGEGAVTRFQYGLAPNGEGSSVVDALKRTTGHVHPGGENIARTTNAAGDSDAFTYDQNDRVTSYTTRTGEIMRFAYHQPSGYPAMVTDFSGAMTRVDYLEQMQDGFLFYVPTRVTYPDGGVESFEYDARGNCTRYVDRAGAAWTFTYNGRGQTLDIMNPLGGTSRRTYNDDATPAGATDAGGVERNFSCDALKRLTGVAHADGAETAQEFDAVDNLIARTNELGRTTGFEYDANNRVTASADRSGVRRRFEYDDNSRMTRVVDRAGAESTLGYDAVGNLTQVRNPAGDVLRIEYDDRNRLLALTDDLGDSARFGYDRQGNLTAITDGLGKITALTRDPMGRVTRLTSVTDPNGRIRQLRYDGRGYFAQIDLGGRISRTTAAGTQTYVLNYAHRLPSVSIERVAGADRRYYVFLPGGVLLHSIEAADNSRRSYHFDHAGSTVMLTDDAGAMTDAYAVTPFGESVFHQGPSDQLRPATGVFGVRDAGRATLGACAAGLRIAGAAAAAAAILNNN